LFIDIFWSDVVNLGKPKQFGFDCVDKWNTKQRDKKEFVRNIKLPHILNVILPYTSIFIGAKDRTIKYGCLGIFVTG